MVVRRDAWLHVAHAMADPGGDAEIAGVLALLALAVGERSRLAPVGGITVGGVFFSCTRLHTSYWRDWSSDVCSSNLRGRVVDRQRDRPAVHRREVGEEELRPVDEHDPDGVAVADAELGEPGGDAARVPVELCVG